MPINTNAFQPLVKQKSDGVNITAFQGSQQGLFKTVAPIVKDTVVEGAKTFFKDQVENVKAVANGEVTLKDVVRELPSATVQVGKGIGNFLKEIVQSPLRFASSAGLSVAELVSGKDQSVTLEPDHFAPDKAFELLFGTTELKTFQKQVKEGKELVKTLGGTPTQQDYLPATAIFVGGLLDYTGWGGTAGKAVKPLAKETTERGVKEILERVVKMPASLIDDFAPKIAKETDEKVIAKLLQQAESLADSAMAKALKESGELGVKTLRVAEQEAKAKGLNVADDVLEQVTKTATKRTSREVAGVTAKDLAESTAKKIDDVAEPVAKKIAKQADEIKISETPQIKKLAEEAKKFNNADDFVKALDEGQAGILVDYEPIKRLLERNTGSETFAKLGIDPNETITVYRGIDDPSGKAVRQITEGDYVATSRELAESYTGNPEDVVAKKIKVKDLYIDASEFTKEDIKKGLVELHAEGVYNPNKPITDNELKSIWENATAKTAKQGSQRIPTEGAKQGSKRSAKNPVQKNILDLSSSNKVKLSNKDIISNAGENVSVSIPKNTIFDKATRKLVNSEPFLKIQETFQDSWVRVKRILEREGVQFTDESNPYQQQQLYYGIVGAMQDDLEKTVRSVDTKLVKYADKFKVKAPEMRKAVNDYLHAVHAPERNKALGDGASGLTNAEAKKILSGIEGKTYNKEVKEIANEFKKLNDDVLEILKDGEIIDEELYKTLRKKYPNHVPLQRIIPEDTTDDAIEILATRGFSVRGSKPIKTAKGSDLEVRDIQGNIIANYRQAIERAQKNQIDLATAKMARENKMFDGLFEEIKPKAIGKTFDGEGIVFEKIDDPLVLAYREAGKQRYLKVNDIQVAKALQDVNKQQLGAIMRGIAVVTRFYSGMATRFNPEFALSNIIRDTQDLFVNVFQSRGLKTSSKSVARTPKSATDVLAWLAGKDTKGAKLYQQMRLDGGTTGGLGLSTRKEIDLTLKQIQKESENLPLRTFRKAVRTIDNYNAIFEDATRLSAYKSALESGLTRKQSAFIAKNATVNFNTKGTASSGLNALYMFANASVQGQIRTIKALRNPKVAGTVMAMLTGISFGSRSHNDSVDPDWRDKVSPYDLQHSFIWVQPPSEDGKFRYMTIPVSWGLKPMKILADRMQDASSGYLEDVPSAFGDVASSFIDAYNPVGGTDFFSTVTPSILDLPAEIVRNKGWHGGIIFPDWKEGLPASEQIFESTNESLRGKTAIEISKQLEKANIDASPEVLEYIYDQLVGGAGRAVTRTFETATGLFTDADIDPTEKVFINRFLKEKDPQAIERQVIRAREADLKKELKEEKDLIERKDMIRDYVRDLEQSEAQSILFKLRDIGHDTKGVSYSNNPQKPRRTKDKETNQWVYPTVEDWYAYYRSRKFNYTREEARELAEGMVKGRIPSTDEPTTPSSGGGSKSLDEIFGGASGGGTPSSPAPTKSLEEIFQ